jgi:hypothetical protein
MPTDQRTLQLTELVNPRVFDLNQDLIVAQGRNGYFFDGACMALRKSPCAETRPSLSTAVKSVNNLSIRTSLMTKAFIFSGIVDMVAEALPRSKQSKGCTTTFFTCSACVIYDMPRFLATISSGPSQLETLVHAGVRMQRRGTLSHAEDHMPSFGWSPFLHVEPLREV